MTQQEVEIYNKWFPDGNYTQANISNAIMDGIQQERERSKKLLDLLTDINKSLYVGRGEIETAITEYKNNNQ